MQTAARDSFSKATGRESLMPSLALQSGKSGGAKVTPLQLCGAIPAAGLLGLCDGCWTTGSKASEHDAAAAFHATSGGINPTFPGIRMFPESPEFDHRVWWELSVMLGGRGLRGLRLAGGEEDPPVFGPYPDGVAATGDLPAYCYVSANKLLRVIDDAFADAFMWTENIKKYKKIQIFVNVVEPETTTIHLYSLAPVAASGMTTYTIPFTHIGDGKAIEQSRSPEKSGCGLQHPPQIWSAFIFTRYPEKRVAEDIVSSWGPISAQGMALDEIRSEVSNDGLFERRSSSELKTTWHDPTTEPASLWALDGTGISRIFSLFDGDGFLRKSQSSVESSGIGEQTSRASKLCDEDQNVKGTDFDRCVCGRFSKEPRHFDSARWSHTAVTYFLRSLRHATLTLCYFTLSSSGSRGELLQVLEHKLL